MMVGKVASKAEKVAGILRAAGVDEDVAETVAEKLADLARKPVVWVTVVEEGAPGAAVVTVELREIRVRHGEVAWLRTGVAVVYAVSDGAVVIPPHLLVEGEVVAADPEAILRAIEEAGLPAPPDYPVL